MGDLPLVGQLFRSQASLTSKKNLVIFVTPTIIDPAGNRVHTSDNLPYDPNSIPVQKPAVK
jgi:type II secretory pathway component GspD/PulD (secretin)